MTKQDLLKHGEELADPLRGYCYCPGPTCSGCEEMSTKLYRKGFTAAVELLWPLVEVVQKVDQVEDKTGIVIEYRYDEPITKQALKDLESKLNG